MCVIRRYFFIIIAAAREAERPPSSRSSPSSWNQQAPRRVRHLPQPFSRHRTTAGKGTDWKLQETISYQISVNGCKITKSLRNNASDTLKNTQIHRINDCRWPDYTRQQESFKCLAANTESLNGKTVSHIGKNIVRLLRNKIRLFQNKVRLFSNIVRLFFNKVRLFFAHRL